MDVHMDVAYICVYRRNDIKVEVSHVGRHEVSLGSAQGMYFLYSIQAIVVLLVAVSYLSPQLT